MGGGGKSGGGATQQAPVMNTSTVLGDELEMGVQALEDDTAEQTDAVDIAKMGTRGLQIPLTSDNSTTAPTATAATTGVQV